VQIKGLPKEARIVLDEHRMSSTVGEGEDQRTVYGEPLPDAPVWWYKPLNPRDRARWAEIISAADKNETYIDLVLERLTRVDNLMILDEDTGVEAPFEKVKNIDDLSLEWIVSLGIEIFLGAHLSRVDLGK
jgi:hypothetical protein